MKDLDQVTRLMIAVILDRIGKRSEVKEARNVKGQEDLDLNLRAKEEKGEEDQVIHLIQVMPRVDLEVAAKGNSLGTQPNLWLHEFV